jgi:hypothetical protein
MTNGANHRHLRRSRMVKPARDPRASYLAYDIIALPLHTLGVLSSPGGISFLGLRLSWKAPVMADTKAARVTSPRSSPRPL